jgi:hypothetical protein
MRRPFTLLVAFFLLVLAGLQGTRALLGIEVTVAGHAIPVTASWAAFAILLFMGLMVLAEMKR